MTLQLGSVQLLHQVESHCPFLIFIVYFCLLSTVIGPIVGGTLGGVFILIIIIVIISSVICWYKHIGICAKLHERKTTCTTDINQNDEIEVDTLDQQLMKTQFMKL